MMSLTVRCSAGLAAALVAGACAMNPPVVHQVCADPDAQLAAALKPLEALRAKGCAGTAECERLRQEVARLVLVCPGHAPTLMANAVIAYDERQPVAAQQFLDEILARAGGHADAAVLRARIAIEEGNLPFARRLLEQQIRLVPDHGGLREAHGAALYLDGKLPDARLELAKAAALGAPGWRVSYHLGLVAEAAGQIEEARGHYTDALKANPGWAPAESRLRGLRLAGTVR